MVFKTRPSDLYIYTELHQPELSMIFRRHWCSYALHCNFTSLELLCNFVSKVFHLTREMSRDSTKYQAPNYNACPARLPHQRSEMNWNSRHPRPAWNERRRKGRGFQTKRLERETERTKGSKDRRRVQLALLGGIDRGDGRRNPARLKRIVFSDALRPTSQHFPGFSPLVFVRLRSFQFRFRKFQWRVYKGWKIWILEGC